MSMSTLLTLVRHGHTEWNALGRYQGHAPIPLSERGHSQARHLAAALTQGEKVTAIYSSDLPRCRQTVAPIADALGLPVFYDPRFREMDYGHWQGLTRAELAALDADRYEAYRADPFNAPIPGGESQRMLAVRVLAGLADILAAYRGGHVLLITHGGPIREILRYYGRWEGGLPAGNASRTVLALTDDGRTAALVACGDVSHLPPRLQPEAGGTAFIAGQ